MDDKPQRGRPRDPAKLVPVTTRVTPEERARLVDEAKRQGVALSLLVRAMLRVGGL